MADDVAQSLALVWGGGFVERGYDPVHLALGEVAAEVAGEPELGPGQVGRAVVSLVDLVGVVELAIVFSFPALMVSCGMSIEITYAKVWTTARLDCCSVDRPVGGGRSGMTCADAEEGNQQKQSNSMHGAPLVAGSMHPPESWRKPFRQSRRAVEELVEVADRNLGLLNNRY